jgi:hypothetical protein
MQPSTRTAATTAQRCGDAAIGLLLLACGAAVLLLLTPWDWKAMLAAAVLLLLGLHALHSAWRARPSLLSRLGPLP